MGDVVIRPMTVDDVEEVAGFHHRTVLVAYAGIFPPEAPEPTIEQLASEWTDDQPNAWVARDGGVVGTVVARGGDIRRLIVATDRWRQGIGRRLLETGLHALVAHGHDTARLWVLEDNDRARAFYERLGWMLEPGELLVHRSGVREVRYRLPLGR